MGLFKMILIAHKYFSIILGDMYHKIVGLWPIHLINMDTSIENTYTFAENISMPLKFEFIVNLNFKLSTIYNFNFSVNIHQRDIRK